MNAIDIHSKLDSYGVQYEGDQSRYVEPEADMTLADLSESGGKIVKVRFIGGEYFPGVGKCYDLSYIQGEVNGARIRITHTPSMNLVPRHKLKGALIDWAKSERVFAKGLGLLDQGNWSLLS